MRVFSFSITFIIITLLLIGCSFGNISSITIHEMESFSEVKEESEMEITDSNEIKVFQTAVKGSKKEPGIVDMADPQYKFELGQKTYYLWISAGLGTIMNKSNTHTIYSLTSEDAGQVFEVISKKYGD